MNATGSYRKCSLILYSFCFYSVVTSVGLPVEKCYTIVIACDPDLTIPRADVSALVVLLKSYGLM